MKSSLTDMSDPHYDARKVKAEYAASRRKYTKALRKEGDFNEDGELFKKSFDWDITKRLLTYLRPYRTQFILAILLMLAYSALVPAFPRLTSIAVDNYLTVNPNLELKTLEQRLGGLTTIVFLYLGLKLLNFGFRYGYTFIVTWLGQCVVYDIRREIFSKTQRLHLGFFDRTPVGRLITRITTDVDAIQEMMQGGIVGLVADIGLLVGLMIYMLSINWRLALVTLAIMPILFLCLNLISTRIRDAYRAVRLRTSRSNAYLAENLNGMKTVQLFNRESRNQQAFDKINLALLDAQVEQIRWFSLFYPTVNMFGSFATSLILFFGAYYLIGTGSGRGDVITIGVLIAFVQYSQQFFRPLQDLSDKFNILQAAMASSERIFELLDTPEKIANRSDPFHVQNFRGEVKFEDVSFAYQDEEWVLRDLNFTIKPGESVAFVGHTGAGKTTIISLVSRFYDVQKGSIKIDGKDVRDYDQVSLRRHVGIVLQDPFLFSGTIKSNITLNDDTIPLEQVIKAAKFVNAHPFIEKLPQGYDTPVRERGAGFSTGQKQLIAFARALVQNPDILLVLDEATANVDTETEELIQGALKKLMQGRTSIIIAHRLSTIQDADRIMVMRKGKLIEEGSHVELLKQEGYYRKLYELQYREKAKR
ncbi:MAG: ABC transporter ATP-binding protein [Trueperaceae bacterium]